MRKKVRNAGIAIAAVLVAYALYGYVTDHILIFSGRTGAGPQYARGEQAALAALGYVAFAIAALIVGFGGIIRSVESEGGHRLGLAPGLIWAVVVGIVGILLLGFRTGSAG